MQSTSKPEILLQPLRFAMTIWLALENVPQIGTQTHPRTFSNTKEMQTYAKMRNIVDGTNQPQLVIAGFLNHQQYHLPPSNSTGENEKNSPPLNLEDPDQWGPGITPNLYSHNKKAMGPGRGPTTPGFDLLYDHRVWSFI